MNAFIANRSHSVCHPEVLRRICIRTTTREKAQHGFPMQSCFIDCAEASEGRSFGVPQDDSNLRRRGATAVLAMMFLMIVTTLTVGMYSMSMTNMQSAASLSEVTRARSAAESGLQWMQWRFVRMSRPKTTIGVIDASTAGSLWPSIRSAIVTDLNTMTRTAERVTTTTATSITSSPISLDGSDARFTIKVEQHPLVSGDTLDERYLRVTSTGTYGEIERSVSMEFKIDKKIKFAVVGKVPIQLGRNTIVEGPVAMATASKYPPIYMLSDFTHLASALATRVGQFEAMLEQQNKDYDGVISVNDTASYNAAVAQGFTDYDKSGYLDELDLFVQQYDTNGDRAVSKSEFTNPGTGKLYDANLFAAIDSLGSPLFAGDTDRFGYNDGKIDANDAYAKLRGQIVMATSASAWQASMSGGNTIYDMIKGPVESDTNGAAPVKFSATTADMLDLSPANFEEACNNFKAKAGTAGGTTVKTTGVKITNTTLAASDANATAVTEKTPYGSTTYQATYKRPVFKNMTFKNVIVPKGLNALFDNCKFEGVTFVDTEKNITTSGGSVSTSPSDGSSWAGRKVSGDTFTKDKILLATGTPTSGQAITLGSQKGNNLRFNNCTFNGPLAGAYSTAYTHYANSWEFTGATLFDNQVDQTATIVSPQVNIEMGSFTNPDAAPSTLVGVVVAGNIDIRGTSIVDGSIIVTGDGAGNTTLGYFGASDSDTNPTALPEGGYGRLNIRYNPTRALPDGINVAIDITPDAQTYEEGL